MQTALKDVLKLYPATVTVISAREPNGGLLAITATAVTVLTLDPPTMLACVNRNTLFANKIDGASHFCINVLATDQTYVSAACAGRVPQGQRETAADWTDSTDGVPMLRGALANIVCARHEANVPGGHKLMLGEVVEVSAKSGAAPLIYFDQGYRELAPAQPRA